MSLPLLSRSSNAPRSASRALIARIAVAVVVGVFSALGGAMPARALPVDVFFDGNRPASNPSTAFGISLASAIDARDNFGVPIIDRVDLLTTIGSRISVTIPDPSTLVLDPVLPTSANNTAISNWQIDNSSGGTFEGTSFLLFTHTTPYDVGSRTIEYVDENVGLRIDAADGWVIVRGQSQGIDYYYPALRLGENVEAGDRIAAAIHYLVNEPLTGIRRNGRTDYYLPQLQLGFAQVVIPEPGTALLLGFGLTILAAQRKRA
ncbi:MAG: PEP-CTERM sorting domain-containing protein [Myxococcota bacterium]